MKEDAVGTPAERPARQYFAHVNPAAIAPEEKLHPLEAHLRKVALGAAKFAVGFGPEWAELAGRWHDLGKYRNAFQEERLGINAAQAHIETNGKRVTHSTAGAVYAQEKLGSRSGRVLAYLIAGHHAGLPDWRPDEIGAAACLSARLQSGDAKNEYEQARAAPIPADILAAPDPTALLVPVPGRDRHGFALWVRMLFSCLVDADFLDTETFFSPDKAAARGAYPTLEAMQRNLASHLSEMCVKALPTAVNRVRAEVLSAARSAAGNAPGFYTLTVPTGGGKTLTSLAFALDHALKHGKRRIIYAIPYTSIIEQTAQVFREIFLSLGTDAVLEHHSNLDVAVQSENHASRLASENWDAPLIVTTNVQLFESLHSARTSRCRKLHNLVDSVIVLDEAQLLPSEFLAPVIRVLKELVAHYGVTVVLCTATQPALGTRHEYLTGRTTMHGIDGATEIVGTPAQVTALFEALQRVEVRGLDALDRVQSWDETAIQLAEQHCALAIVNTRAHALELHAKVCARTACAYCIHLSALMCAEHRSTVIKDIRARLKANAQLIVISTQLVEAGVDLDFPVVFRALAGLDSIAQAAGRCNREGKAKAGVVHVFNPGGKLPGSLGQGINATLHVLQAGPLLDPLAPETFNRYFNAFYDRADLDKHRIGALLSPDEEMAVGFRSAAAKFRLIDDEGESVVVPYLPEKVLESPIYQWLAVLAKDQNTGWARRKLQRFTVTLRKAQFERMLAQGDIEERCGLFVALPSRYDAIKGLLLPEDSGEIGGYII